MVEPLVNIALGVAEIVCLFTGRTVLTALSLGRIKPERFWGRSQSGRFGFSRMPDGTIIVDDFWTTLCGFAVWAMVVCLGLLLHSQRP